ncbi:MAG: LON peptidase substrate-binding domain-containing protein [Sandaracinaceae bacterium]|nr:LON peptidase substrate-binding domain-containing protein [Sandaracinaceae bacterium]
MSPEDLTPLAAHELAALPVFPLPRVVFFPGTRLPLHVFEPRYRQMMQDCLEHGPRAMAVALLAPGWEEDYEGRPAIHTIAGAGRIIEHERRPDGRYDLALYGAARVRLEELPPDGLPYRRARATIVADRMPHADAVQRALTPLVATASAIAGRVRERYPAFDLGISASTPSTLVADRIADRLIADPETRQALLEQADLKVRLALLQDALAELIATLETGRGTLQ